MCSDTSWTETAESILQARIQHKSVELAGHTGTARPEYIGHAQSPQTWIDLLETLWEVKQMLLLSHIEQISLWLPHNCAACWTSCISAVSRMTVLPWTLHALYCWRLQQPQFVSVIALLPPDNFSLALGMLERFLGIYMEKSTLLSSFYTL